MNLFHLTFLRALLSALAFAGVIGRTFADRVVVDGRVEVGGKVLEIQGRTVTVEGRESRFQNAERVMLDRAPLPQAEKGIILKDGTRLAGIELDRNKEQVVFYAVSAGRLALPPGQVAGKFYEPAHAWRDSEFQAPALITRSGEVVAARRIMWADDQTVAVLTENGLRKFSTSSVSRVWWSVPANGEGVRLRNGDVLQAPVRFRGKTFSFSLAGREFSLPLEAVETIHFPTSH